MSHTVACFSVVNVTSRQGHYSWWTQKRPKQKKGNLILLCQLAAHDNILCSLCKEMLNTFVWHLSFSEKGSGTNPSLDLSIYLLTNMQNRYTYINGRVS